MADKLATVEEASTMLGVLSALDSNKCITISELENMVNSMRVCDIIYDIIGSSYREQVMQGLVAINTSNYPVYISANTGAEVAPHSYQAWYFTNQQSIEVGGSCYAIFFDQSTNLIKCLYIESHGNFSTKSGVVII